MGKKFVFIDLETTGLDPQNDKILEVALRIVHEDLSTEGALHTWVIDDWYARAMFEQGRVNEYVRTMHLTSGLLPDLYREGNPKRQAVESAIVSLLDAYPGHTLHYAGFSVHFDANFIAQWMPRVHERMHHRHLDLSSLKLWAEAVGLEVEQPENPAKHRAAADVNECLQYLRNFNKALNIRPEVWLRAHDPKHMMGAI